MLWAGAKGRLSDWVSLSMLRKDGGTGHHQPTGVRVTTPTWKLGQDYWASSFTPERAPWCAVLSHALQGKKPGLEFQ